MSIASPLYGVDVHAEYQRGFDFKRAASQGYKFAIHKTSQGKGRRWVPDGFEEFFHRSAEHMPVSGFYEFLDGTASGEAQAHSFLNTIGRVGGARGRLIAVDFEGYGDLSPTNKHLEDFVRVVKRNTNNHAVIIYSSVSFWNSGNPSGPFEHYGADAAWEARYPDNFKHRMPKLYYQAVRRWYGWHEGFGGVRPMMWQFTSGGKVAGQFVDVNAFRGETGDLLALTTRSAREPTNGVTSGLPDYIRKPLAYLEDCVGGKYTPWTPSDGKFGDGPPAWAANSDAPPYLRIKDRGSFCAGTANLAARVNGLRIFADTTWWYGGVPWWANRLIDRKRVAQRFTLDRTYPPGTLFIRRFTGNALADQGHLSIMGRHGKLLQADFFPDEKNGINENRTLRETHSLLQHFDGGGFEYFVRPEDWLR